ncbi:MAG: TrkH family potassium uptake protein [Pirellulales bacterium]
MNLRLVVRQLGTVSLLIAGAMLFSLPWALGETGAPRTNGLVGLGVSIAVCVAAGLAMRHWGRGIQVKLYRKESMAIVGLSWILATILGALPFLFSGTERETGVPMNVADALFESQSGFSTTGATVLTNLEDPEMVPRSILFWRSTTHFLGGLGIMVLFVAMLGQGSAGKALMRAEMPGPSSDSPITRMQHTAWLLCVVYVVLNMVLTAILWLEGLSVFDALCHAFGTMATGGFSTYNASLGHFETVEGVSGVLVEMTVLVFMVLAGTNFMLLYFALRGKFRPLLCDVEWRTYIGVIVLVTAAVICFAFWHRDFHVVKSTFIDQPSAENLDTEIVSAEPHETLPEDEFFPVLGRAIRYGLFQVVSIMTTTGYGTHDFNAWNSFGRGVLFLLMFVGGCAGSTGGGLKVIRHILFLKILGLEVEQSFRPSIVRPLRLGGKALENQDLRRNVVVYFSLILVIFVFSWITIVTFEPDTTWQGRDIGDKLIDSATGVAATLNNIGPGLGTVGATENYAKFSSFTKLLFTLLMMLGRLEIFVILVLFLPSFWRTQ